MLNFMSSFTPNSLANENTVYQWNDSHIIAFEKIKDRISADTLLAYYDWSQPVTRQADAEPIKGDFSVGSTHHKKYL